jgi:hypothetical protein
MGLLEFQAMPSLHDIQLMTMFYVHLVMDQPQTRASGVVRQGSAAWAAHHVQNHTLLGHSPPASQAGRRVEAALLPSASL